MFEIYSRTLFKHVMSYVKVSITFVLRYMYVIYLFRVTFVHRYRRPHDTTLSEHHIWPECKTSKSPFFRCKISPLFVYLEVLLDFLFLLEVHRTLTNVICFCIFSINSIYGNLTVPICITFCKC